MKTLISLSRFSVVTFSRFYTVNPLHAWIVIISLALSPALGVVVSAMPGVALIWVLDGFEPVSLVLLIVGYSLFWLLSRGLTYLVYPLYGALEQAAQTEIALEALNHTYCSSRPARARQDDGELAYAIDGHMSAFREVLGTLLLAFLPAVSVLASGAIALSLVGGWPVGILYVLSLVLFIVLSMPLIRRHQQVQGAFYASALKNFGVLSNYVAYWREVAIFGLHGQTRRNYQKSRIVVEKAGVQSYRATRNLYLGQILFLALLLAVLMGVYAALNKGQEMDMVISGLVALIGVALYSIQTVQDIGFGLSSLGVAMAKQEEASRAVQGNGVQLGQEAIEIGQLRQLIATRRRGIIWLCGESGSGKTSLLEALLGFRAVADAEVVPLDTFSTVRYLPQSTNLIFDTAYQVIQADRALPGEDIDRMLRELGLPDFTRAGRRSSDAVAGEGNALSGGEARRVALVRTLLGPQDSLVVLDEPTTGIGSGHRAAVWQQIRQIAEYNLVVVVTHDADAPTESSDTYLQVGQVP